MDATIKSELYQKKMPMLASQIAKAMRSARDANIRDTKRILETLRFKAGMTEKEAKMWLSSYTPMDMINELRNRAVQAGNKKLVRRMDYYRSHFNYPRKQFLRDTISLNSFESARAVQERAIKALIKQGSVAYTYATYEIAKKIGVGVAFGGISVKRLEKIANDAIPFTRAYGSVDNAVGRTSQEILLKGVLQGRGPKDIGREIAKETGTIPYRAKAFARTAITEVSNASEIEALDDAGIHRYEVIATLDEVTCEICGEMDGKTFDIEDKSVGVNCPPFHYNCRCTTGAAITKEVKDRLTRSAKAGGEWSRVPASMTYREWSKKFVKG